MTEYHATSRQVGGVHHEDGADIGVETILEAPYGTLAPDSDSESEHEDITLEAADNYPSANKAYEALLKSYREDKEKARHDLRRRRDGGWRG